MTFNEELDEHGAWRKRFSARLSELADWLTTQDLLQAAVRERLDQLRAQVRNDKIMVAFVAEFSRGKSELINAVFFAGYGRRIMPASAGRTTMCPTEIGYDEDVPPCLRLLPIETRLQPQSLQDWRLATEKWEHFELDVNDGQQLARAIRKVADVRRVPPQEAEALGFWSDESSHGNPLLGADGLVEVPKWRHALINLAHPLLRQGLVILDTPGLNAIGAEPELTVSLLPQAHAVVFILAADAGVTQSDLSIWREHLGPTDDALASRMVVLNKIDTLWDGITPDQQVQLQIAVQRKDAAAVLGVPIDRVLAVSAQKGLLAKIQRDDRLLQDSHLLDFEATLGQGLLGQRRDILVAAVSRGVHALRSETARLVHTRLRNILEQIQELDGLRGKNTGVIQQMRLRIEQEQADFDASGAKIQAVRSVHLRLLRDLLALFSENQLRRRVATLTQALRQPGIKLGLKRAYGATFQELAQDIGKAESLVNDTHSMLETSFRNLNAEYGFTLQAPNPPRLGSFYRELELISDSHLQYLSFGNALRLVQAEFADRLVRALTSRLRVVYESMTNEIEAWNKTTAAQLDAQLRERRRNFGRRIEAVARIQQAAGGLDERIRELQAQQARLSLTDARLGELTDLLLGEAASQAVPA